MAGSDSSNLPEARAVYHSLVERRKRLQEERANCDLDLKQAALHPDFYDSGQLAKIREHYHTVNVELDRVIKQEASLIADHPLLREQLERKLSFGVPESVRAEAEEGAHGQQPHSNRLHLTKLSDLLDEPEEQVSWLVDKLLPSAGFSLLVAKPKAGKSTLARNLALAVAQDKGFLNKATQQGAVIYLALEEKRAEVKKHFKDMGATGAEDIYIHAASAPADALEQIRVAAEEKKPALIIIDPLFRLTRIKDGNDYAQVTAALEPLLVLARETGSHVLCVHHAGKGDREGGDSILGSTAIFAAVDTALFMKRSERYRTISSQQRYGEDLPETVLHFDSETRTITLGVSKEQEEVNRLKAPILEFLKGQEEAITEKEIKDNVEGNNRHKQTALRELVTEEKVERQGKGSKGDSFKYKCSLSHSSQDIKSESENPKEGTSQHQDSGNSHFGTSPFSGDSETPPSEHQATGANGNGHAPETDPPREFVDDAHEAEDAETV